MSVTDIGDPRLQQLFGPEAAASSRVKPVVRLPGTGPSGWIIAAVMLGAAILLFLFLDSKRGAQPEPEVRPRGDSSIFSPEPPPLYIPPAPQVETLALPVAEPTPPPPAPIPQSKPRTLPAAPPEPIYERPMMQPMPVPSRPTPRSSGPALIIDTTAPSAPPAASGSAAAGPGSQGAARARASKLANRSNTVAQGALIPAVLETAFDSTSAGLARAIVSRDVRGFDGKKVLVPRGSRLIGRYGSEVAAGQNRAAITWTRLVRPDGVTIALDSPATDTVGRGGVRASVDSHFWTRLGDAVVGSAANLGTSLATRAATGSLILSLPGSAPQQAIPAPSGRIVPTLRIKAGTSISVFVARDLEFPDSGSRE